MILNFRLIQGESFDKETEICVNFCFTAIAGCRDLCLCFPAISKVFGFPIPVSAKLVKDKQSVEMYKWWEASEVNGLPYVYRKEIQWCGWKQIDREGAMTIYEKMGKKCLSFHLIILFLSQKKTNRSYLLVFLQGKRSTLVLTRYYPKFGGIFQF